MSALGTLLEQIRALPPVRTAIVAPYDVLSLGGAAAAALEGIIEPVLVGERASISQAAREGHLDVDGLEMLECSTADVCKAAAESAARGDVAMVMKGAVHSDELLHAVLTVGLVEPGCRLSHIVVSDMPDRETPVLITDGAVNIAPDLTQKAQIVKNAVKFARQLGIERPRVAVLAAVETVNASMQATLDAAALSEMARHGQIEDADVDGPLALDDALSAQAAWTKHFRSVAAGNADILVAPDLQSGNILYKAFDVLVHARFGALVAGARVPIAFTSRADSIDARLLSCALARLMFDERKHHGNASRERDRNAVQRIRPARAGVG